jgi:hypothetical protein
VDNRSVIRNPTLACDDWIYRAGAFLPAPRVITVVAIVVALVLPTINLYDAEVYIVHERSVPEKLIPLFLPWLFLIYFMGMPLLYVAILECFDHLCESASAGVVEMPAIREQLIHPGHRFQILLFLVSITNHTIASEVTSTVVTRFFTGDWNVVDLWYFSSGAVANLIFVWIVMMPISRMFILTRFIRASVTPRLFDIGIGQSLATIAVRAGLVLAIPTALQTAAIVAIASGTGLNWSWQYLFPQVIAGLLALAFILVPASALAKRIRRTKRAEIENINGAINAEISVRDNLIRSKELKGGILHLLEYRAAVIAIPEWPVNLANVRLFWIYLLIAPLTWVASAFVQVIIERLTLS